jgi:ribonuclease P protein component
VLARRRDASCPSGSQARVAAGTQLFDRRPWQSLKTGDFAAALSGTALSKTTHFVLHHLAAEPVSSGRRPGEPLVPELSTDVAPKQNQAVDNSNELGRWWLGLVVPKRHARRAVTRSLIKHQMRAQADLHQDRLPCGQWVLRLRAPFDPRRYPSAASPALQQAARIELAQVFADAVVA